MEGVTLYQIREAQAALLLGSSLTTDQIAVIDRALDIACSSVNLGLQTRLRDEFAMAALTGMIASNGFSLNVKAGIDKVAARGGIPDNEAIAKEVIGECTIISYGLADAMLKARIAK